MVIRGCLMVKMEKARNGKTLAGWSERDTKDLFGANYG